MNSLARLVVGLAVCFVVACDPAPARCPDGTPGPICFDEDGGPAADVPLADSPDSSLETGPPVPMCGMIGAIGGHCRGAVDGIGGMCASGLRCQNELRPAGGTAPFTIRAAFGIEQGTNVDPDTGFYEEVPTAMAVPGNDIPVPMATGSLCTQDCDAGATTDACGTCSTCSTDIGTAGLLATFLLTAPAMRPFGTDSGWCRSDCVFDAATAGATCPGMTGPTGADAHTCSPASGVCVEGCISDNECRFSFEETRDGLFVSVVDATIPSSCNATTHRCEWTHASTSSVGDPCTHSSDCSEDVGVCLNGGTCAEYECGRAADTETTTVCDGGRGVCLGNGGNQASICVEGCTMPSDCNAGSTCVPLGMGRTAGTFTGYCLGICDSVLNDPDGAAGPMSSDDDALILCQTGEQCDYPDPTATNLDPTGDCRRPCAIDGDCTDRTPDEGNYCDIVAGTSPAFGFCRWQGQVCSPQDLSADCYGTEVCDLLAFPENLGRCVAPCTDATGTNPCTGADVCVTAGGRNVCRTPCTTGGTACPMGQLCQGTAPAQFCEQMTTT